MFLVDIATSIATMNARVTSSTNYNHNCGKNELLWLLGHASNSATTHGAGYFEAFEFDSVAGLSGGASGGYAQSAQLFQIFELMFRILCLGATCYCNEMRKNTQADALPLTCNRYNRACAKDGRAGYICRRAIGDRLDMRRFGHFLD